MTSAISKTNTAVKFSLIFKGGQQVVALVMGVVLARILSPSEFGVIALSNMIVYYANSFTNFGLNNALIQKTDIKNVHINTVFTLDFIISSALALLTFSAAGYIGHFFNNPHVISVLQWMSLYYIITTFYHIPIALLRRNIDFKFLTIFEFCESVITSICAITLAYFGYSYWSIVISSLLIQTIAIFVLISRTHWIPKFVIGRDMSDIYSFGFWNFIRAQLELLVSKVDYFVIGKYLNVNTLGLYEKSFELTGRAMSGLSMPLNGVFFSTFSRFKDDAVKIKQLFLQASALVTLICYPVLFGLLSVAPYFVLSCLGAQWQSAIMPIQILAIGSLFRVLSGMVANVNIVIGKYRAHTLLNAVVSVLFIIGCFGFVSNGIIAIAYVYLVYCALAFFSSFYLLNLNIKLTLIDFFGAIWCPLVGSLIMFFSVLLFRVLVFTDVSSFLHFLSLVIVGATVYICWIYYFYLKGHISFNVKG